MIIEQYVALTTDPLQVKKWYKKHRVDPELIHSWVPESEDDDDLQQRITDLGISKLIIFDSWRGDLPDFYFFHAATKYTVKRFIPVVVAGYIVRWKELGTKDIADWSEEKEDKLRRMYHLYPMQILELELGYTQSQIRDAEKRLGLKKALGVTTKPRGGR